MRKPWYKVLTVWPAWVRLRHCRLAIVLVLALVLLESSDTMWPDSNNYLSQALQLLNGNGLTYMDGTPVLFRYVLPLSLASAFRLSGTALPTATVLSKAFAILAVALLYLLGEKLLGDWGGVLAACLLLTGSYFTVTAPVVGTDTLQLVFLLLAYYVLIRSYESGRSLHFLLAAICLALAFFTREDSLLYMLMPLAFLAVDPTYRTKKNLVNVAFLFALFFSLISLQWAYVYLKTGTVYGLEPGGITDMALGVASPGEVSESAAPGLGLLANLRSYLTTAVAAYLVPIPRFAVTFLKPEIELFYPLVLASGASLALAIRGDKAARILSAGFLICMPMLFVTSQWGLEAGGLRHHLLLLAFSFLSLAMMILLAAAGVRRISTAMERPALYNGAVLAGVVALGILLITRSSASESGERRLDDANRGVVLAAADWINRNVPTPSTIVASEAWIGGLYLETSANYEFLRLPVAVTSLAAEQRLGRLLYLYKYPPAEGYYVLNEDDFLAMLRTSRVKYLVYGGGLEYSPLSLLQNISRLDGVSEVFQAQQGPEQIHIFELDPEQVRFREPGVTFVGSADSLTRLIFEEPYSISLLSEDCTDLADRHWVLDLLEDSFVVDGGSEVPWMYNCIGTMSALAGDVERATHAFSQAPAPPGQDLSVTQPFAHHVTLGARHLAKRDWPSAVSEFQKAVSMRPASAAGYVGLGYAYEPDGMPDEAAAAYQRASALEPDDDTILVRLGNLFRRNGHYDAAAHAFETALQKTPTSTEAASGLYATRGDMALLQKEVGISLLDYRLSKSLSLMAPSRMRQLTFYEASLAAPARYTVSELLQSRSHWRMDGPPERLVLDLVRPDPNSADSGMIDTGVFVIDNEPRATLLLHPPFRLAYAAKVPRNARLRFGIALSPEVWRLGKGDGVQFDLGLEDGTNTFRLFSEYIDPKNIPADRKWHDQEVDLSMWAGQTVTLTLMTGPGPNGNADFDWAGWGAPRIVQPAYYSFLEQFSRTADAAETDDAHPDWLVIGNELRDVLVQRPPSRTTFADVAILPDSTLSFGLSLDLQASFSTADDGVGFEILIGDAPGHLVQVFEQTIDPQNSPDDRRWLDFEVDLNRFAGQTVDVHFATHAGSGRNGDNDWAVWSNPVLFSTLE
ncbi:glycosyltransferase family 39 protein [Chloroflexota bacterium]